MSGGRSIAPVYRPVLLPMRGEQAGAERSSGSITGGFLLLRPSSPDFGLPFNPPGPPLISLTFLKFGPRKLNGLSEQKAPTEFFRREAANQEQNMIFPRDRHVVYGHPTKISKRKIFSVVVGWTELIRFGA